VGELLEGLRVKVELMQSGAKGDSKQMDQLANLIIRVDLIEQKLKEFQRKTEEDIQRLFLKIQDAMSTA